ncbi:MAG TPA: 3-hydroxyacyl-CoA dehydrogenase NAD-binding domain-containing protein [Gaiellaceae bacterium]|nr:3-hydroxyacyl-CoA dehydrogenase NAD-binding domain-containing protein [Gaiellaceae bacterium]
MTAPVTEFRLERLDSPHGTTALVTMHNGDSERPNVLGREALESLAAVLPELEGGDFAALVLTGKPGSFCAGADVDAFPRISSAEEAIEASRAGHDLFARVRALPYPTVAAINGGALGGGVEIALHCDYRVIADDVRHFASPECLLGFVPAWGATQLAPRLAGAEAAVKLIVLNPMRQNKMLDAATAHELGFVDRVVEAQQLLDASLTIARERPERPDVELADAEEVVARARRTLDDSVHGAAPAPYRALDLIVGAADWSIEEGYRNEEQALGELLFTPQARASLYAFDLVERRAKRQVGRPEVEPRPIRKVGIAGAGLMATQLATLVLRRMQVPLVLRDVDDVLVSQGIEQIRDELAGAAARGRINQETAVALASLVAGSTRWDGFADCDFVIEAVFEQLDVKREVFGDLEQVVPAECVLATNTSALSVTDMAAGLRQPERVVGLHFFNPVALMPLVELVRTPETDDAALATAFDVAARLRKRPVLVNDAPGFVVNRLLTRMMTVVLDAIENGNSTEEADEAVLRLGLPMAPSVLVQMVGPRVANYVLETLNEAYPDRFPRSRTLANYAAGKDKIVRRGDERRSPDEILEAVREALADETRHLLDEGVVASAKDVDTALILGAGFPFFLGGITKHLDLTAVSERVAGRTFAEVGTAARA